MGSMSHAIAIDRFTPEQKGVPATVVSCREMVGPSYLEFGLRSLQSILFCGELDHRT